MDNMVETMNEYAEEAYKFHVMDKDEVRDTLTVLKEKFSLNILTASPHRLLDPCLKRLGLWDLFDNVWSCDDFSTTKADVNIYKMAAERIGVSVDEVLFLDDNYNADKTAVEAGMKVCGVYDESSR